jgi:hypothetical protein
MCLSMRIIGCIYKHWDKPSVFITKYKCLYQITPAPTSRTRIIYTLETQETNILFYLIFYSYSAQLAAQSKGVCTHTGKTGAWSDSGAGCNVNKWVYSHAAGPARSGKLACRT